MAIESENDNADARVELGMTAPSVATAAGAFAFLEACARFVGSSLMSALSIRRATLLWAALGGDRQERRVG